MEVIWLCFFNCRISKQNSSQEPVNTYPLLLMPCIQNNALREIALNIYSWPPRGLVIQILGSKTLMSLIPACVWVKHALRYESSCSFTNLPSCSSPLSPATWRKDLLQLVWINHEWNLCQVSLLMDNVEISSYQWWPLDLCRYISHLNKEM